MWTIFEGYSSKDTVIVYVDIPAVLRAVDPGVLEQVTVQPKWAMHEVASLRCINWPGSSLRSKAWSTSAGMPWLLASGRKGSPLVKMIFSEDLLTLTAFLFKETKNKSMPFKLLRKTQQRNCSWSGNVALVYWWRNPTIRRCHRPVKFLSIDSLKLRSESASTLEQEGSRFCARITSWR